MKWTKIKRSSGLIEYVCEHGVGHPDPHSAIDVATKHGHDASTWLTHGCDGCCGEKDFPATSRRDELK